MHDVGFGEIHGSDFVGGLELTEGEGEAFADAVVVDGEDVGTAEAEDQEHFNGPSAYAANLYEMFDDGFVGHAADVFEIGDGAVDGLCGEIAEGEHLVFGEAGSAELLVGAVEEVLRAGMVWFSVGGDAADVVEAFDHAAMDGGGGFAVELLIDDGFDERFEWGLRAGYAEFEGACAFDEFAESGIGGGEFATGESEVIARRAWIIAVMRHVLTVSQGAEECLANGGEFGLDWFAFTNGVPVRQGRCSGEFSFIQRSCTRCSAASSLVSSIIECCRKKSAVSWHARVSSQFSAAILEEY